MPLKDEDETLMTGYMVVTKELFGDRITPYAKNDYATAFNDFMMQKHAYELREYNKEAHKWQLKIKKQADNPYAFGSHDFIEWQQRYGALVEA